MARSELVLVVSELYDPWDIRGAGERLAEPVLLVSSCEGGGDGPPGLAIALFGKTAAVKRRQVGS